MRFSSQDPDIETIVRRISDGDYDLQPDFQRGEVWSTQKKRRLIDSVLRGWHVPPVHLVVGEDGRSDVLDGQQRLTAIRDFVRGHFTVDGTIEPSDPAIARLGGLRYAELPEHVARSFRKFTIRVFELVDYAPDEPHELFFRLNQPTSLTEAEKRNAFVGDARNQVRDLTAWATRSGWLNDRIGFSNARMAYDDVIARVLVTIEARRLDEKVTASRVTARYRAGEAFTELDVETMRQAIYMVSQALAPDSSQRIQFRPNKATLHTWLCIAAQLALGADSERIRATFVETIQSIESARWHRTSDHSTAESRMLALFQDRSTARVADVSSVILRDLIAWMFMTMSNPVGAQATKSHLAYRAWLELGSASEPESAALAFAASHDWGALGWC